MNNIYNVVAYLCSYIINTCEEVFFVHYSCISKSEKERTRNIIKENLPQLFSSQEEQIVQLTKENLTDSFFEKLQALILKLTNTKDFFATTALIQTLDQALANLLLEKIGELEHDDFSTVLNTNRELTGVGLLPRCSCEWERKHRLSHCYNRMDNFLFNMLLMENSILGELIDKHFFLPKSLFPHFSKTKKLTIAATALRRERKFTGELYDKDTVQYFKIVYDTDGWQEDNQLVWNKIQEASLHQTDIIVFPEMLGNPETVSFVQNKIQSLTEEEKQQLPSLIVLPSLWQNKQNTVTLLNKTGQIVYTQNKQNPFRIEHQGSGYLEGIIPSRVINILHFEGIGRIAILICKDFLTTKYMEQLMRCFKLTLILVPSFSTGSYDFRQTLDLCAHDDCNVVWINTCAAIEKGKEQNFEAIGAVRKRISRKDDESHTLCKMPPCDKAFKGTCNHDCMFYETLAGC